MLAYRLIAPTIDDTDRVTALINAAEAFDGVPRILDAAELREELEAPEIDLRRDARMVFDEDVLVGWILVTHEPSGHVQERAFVSGTVLPSHRGRGIGRSIMGWGVDLARQRLSVIDNDLPRFIRIYGYEQIESLHRLVARMGFAQVRWFEELLMPIARRPEVRTPTGVVITPWPCERIEELRQVKNQSFGDHWGSTPSSVEDWDQRVNGFGSRLDTSFVAIDPATDEVVAICLNGHFPADEALSGRRDGWVDTLGTVRAWRGHGLGSALITHSLAAFDRVGFTHAAIAVDSASPTGASRLYRSLGFELQHRQVVSELEVTPTP